MNFNNAGVAIAMAKDSENYIGNPPIPGLVPGFLGFSLDFLQEQC